MENFEKELAKVVIARIAEAGGLTSGEVLELFKEETDTKDDMHKKAALKHLTDAEQYVLITVEKDGYMVTGEMTRLHMIGAALTLMTKMDGEERDEQTNF